MSITPNAFGTANAARQVSPADLALFQTVYQNEVLASFEQATIMLDKHYIRTITNGER